MPDRESVHLKNGTYYAKIVCITNGELVVHTSAVASQLTHEVHADLFFFFFLLRLSDMPSKTATGTIAIQVEDFNDNCPVLTSTTLTRCHRDNFIYVTAKDEDNFPNSVPFEFTVIEEKSKGKWVVEPLNGKLIGSLNIRYGHPGAGRALKESPTCAETSIILRDHAKLWPGTYQVAVDVKDQQGKSCGDVQMMDVVVCTCHEDSNTCKPRAEKKTNISVSGILLLLLGLLLLLRESSTLTSPTRTC